MATPPRRRIPWWVAVLGFAILVGGAIGGFAYLRGRARDPSAFCAGRLPPDARLAALAGHPLRAEPSPGRRAIGHCETRYRGRTGDALVVIRRRPTAYDARLRALGGELRLPAQEVEVGARRAHLFETTVQATAATLVGVLAFSDDEVVELHFDPAVFGHDQAIDVMRAVVAVDR